MAKSKRKVIKFPRSTSPRIDEMFSDTDTSLELLRERRDLAVRDGDMRLAFFCAREIDKIRFPGLVKSVKKIKVTGLKKLLPKKRKASKPGRKYPVRVIRKLMIIRKCGHETEHPSLSAFEVQRLRLTPCPECKDER